MKREKLIIDVKATLEKYLPSIFLLLDNAKIDWNSISTKYQKELFHRLSRLNNAATDSIQVEACLFDLISRQLLGDFSYYNLIKFIDGIFTNLAQKTSSAEKKLLHRTIFNVLINTNKYYLNFIGEFAVLNNIKNAGFELIDSPYAKNYLSSQV